MVHPERLDTWGEIAGFLRVDVKTAQRWERERGLPVRRLPGGRRGHVYAYRAELERWLDGGGANGQPAAEVPAGHSVRLNRRLALAGIAGAVLLPAGWYIARLIRPRPRIASVRMEGQVLVAYDLEGGVLWRRSFQGASPRPPASKSWAEFLQPVDFEGDGRPDLVAALRFEGPEQDDFVLRCFDPGGGIRWNWKPSLRLLDFNGKPFDPIWQITSMLVTRAAGKDNLWVAIGNPLRWASALISINAQGEDSVHFANAGSVMELASVDESERLIVAAGINNAFATVFLALVGEDDPPSVCPLGGPSRYRYKNGPTGSVRRYVLLPQSELKIGGTSEYLTPYRLERVGDGFALSVHALREPTIVYDYSFDRALTPIGVRTTASFALAHGRLERAGLLEHPSLRCPELLTPHVIRSWTPREGWREVPVPVADRNNLK